MNFLKNYKSIFEDRASDKFTGSQHETPYEQVMKYVNVPDTFISFRSIDKIGINPKSKFNTPNGIYCYPLKEISKGFDHQNKKIKVPFAGENPYCYVIQIKNGIKGIKLGEYSKSQLDKDLEKLQIEYRSLTDELIESSIKKSKFKTPGGLIWGITYFLAKELNPNKFPNTWNLLFSKNLNYQYVWDDKGENIIHHHEPLQCVFFNTRSFKILEDVIMKRKEVLSKKKDRTSKAGNRYIEFPDWLKKAKYENEKLSTNKEGKLIWEGGIWENGIWENGIWENGIWENGIWKGGMWKNGKWKKGKWENGKWENGVWEDGSWKNGTWIKGLIYSKRFDEYFNSKINPNQFYEVEKEYENSYELQEFLRE